MPPKACLKPHLTIDRLKSQYRSAGTVSEARRWQVLVLVAQGWTIVRAAEIAGFSYDYAKELVRRYNQAGPEAIASRPAQRRPSVRSLLTPAQQEELVRLLTQPAPDGQAWSGPKVAAWIAQVTGRDHVWPQRGWEYLRRFRDH